MDILPIGTTSFSFLSKDVVPIVQMMFSTIPSPDQQLLIRKNLIKYHTKLVIHAPYQINLAQNNSRNIKLFVEHIKLAYRLSDNIVYVVVHVGKSLKLDKTTAISNFIENMNLVLNQTRECQNTVVLLETPAGQGTELFTNYDEFLSLYDYFDKERFGFCLDTCHLFSSGYKMSDIFYNSSKYKTIKHLLIHLNDSQTPIGSKIDRHESIGIGHIFKNHQELELIVKWALTYKVSIILETPSINQQDELNLLYHMAYPTKNIIVEIRDLGSSDQTIIDDDKLIVEEDQQIIDDIVEEDQQIIDDLDVEEYVNMNKKIVHIFETIARTKDEFRKRALLKAAETIESLDFEITSRQQLIKLPGIGKNILTRIEEILTTGTLEEYQQNKQQFEAINNLTQISGIGPVIAKKLYETHHITNVEQLSQFVKRGEVKLNKTQMSCLKFHEDIQQRIPRNEIDQFDKIIGSICIKIDPMLKHQIVGSYRRGAKDSGDIDILFVHPKLNTKSDVHNSDILAKLISEMTEMGMIDSILSQGKNKILMIAHLPSYDISRRVDFLLTPVESYASALMYFTGSKTFNLLTRNKAIQMGYKLNEYGLFDSNDNRLPIKTEHDIFNYLKLNYIDPINR